jgi:amidase
MVEWVVLSPVTAFSYGTETDGSVIGPARRASIIGIKPTVGLTSRAGVVPESIHQDTVGPFARTFKDAVYALEAIVGVDPRDNYTLAQKVPDGGNYTQFLASKEALRGAVFGLPWSSLWNQTGNRADLPMLLDVVEKLKAAGATIINGTEFPHYKDVLSPRGYTMDIGPSPLLTEAYRTNVDFYNDIRNYLAELENTNMKTLEDIIAFNIQYTGVEGGIPGTVAGFASGQDGFLESAVTKGDMNSSCYECNEYLNRVSRAEGIDAALAYTYPNGTTIQLDGLLVPSGSGSTNLPAIAGYPMVTVPVGQNAHSVPVGIALIGTAWSEPTLIKYGSAIDDLIRRRTLPKFIEWWSKVIPVDYSI